MRKEREELANYVKFLRGTPAAYANLAEKNKDTLYFIYEEDESNGLLYLGSKLIAGSSNDVIENNQFLSDLKDILISENVEANDCLVYDISGKWVNKPIDSILPIFVGTKGDVGGMSGAVPAPTVDETDMFLRSDGTWAKVVADSVEADNLTLENSNGVLSIAGFKDALEGAYPVKNQDGSLTWIQPDLTVINNLQSDVDSIKQILNPVDEDGNAIEGGLISNIENISEELKLKANAEEINNALNLKADASEMEAALNLKANTSDVETALNLKANATDVYTKEATNSAIAAAIAKVDHLKREIVNVLPDIDNAKANIIYMIPNGLQEDDNKYSEWMIIDGVFESVGSWEVDLKDYAKVLDVQNALNEKVNKDENARLMTNDEGIKLFSIEANAEKNIINSMSNDFEIISDETHDRELRLKPITTSKVIDLDNKLNNKVDKEEGWTLLSPSDQAKLAKLSIDDTGNVGISGTVNIENVQGLEDWLNKNAATTPGLSENNLDDDLYNKLVNQLFIKSVNENQLNVTDGHLSLKSIDYNQVTGLADVLELKANVSTVTDLSTQVSTLETSINSHVSDANNRLTAIEDRLTWQQLTV